MRLGVIGFGNVRWVDFKKALKLIPPQIKIERVVLFGDSHYLDDAAKVAETWAAMNDTPIDYIADSDVVWVTDAVVEKFLSQIDILLVCSWIIRNQAILQLVSKAKDSKMVFSYFMDLELFGDKE